MSKYRQGTLEKVKTAKGWTWYLRYTDTTGAKTVRPRVRIGLLSEFPSKSAAWKAADPVMRRLNASVGHLKTFGDLLDRYETEAIPERHDSKRTYLSIVKVHIRPRWGKTPLAEVRAYEVRSWLMGLPVGPRRKGNIHGLMRVLFRFAMLWEWLPAVENPMRLFSLQGSSKRDKEPGTLTRDQFHMLLEVITEEPYRTMVIAAQCLGLRVSELFALTWGAIDFHGQTVSIHSAIVENHLGDVKTQQSKKRLPIHPHIAEVLLRWRGETEFKKAHQFVFASPYHAEQKPYRPGWIQEIRLRPAGKAIGLDFNLGWHTFRHTYRALLRQSGAPMDVQRDLMRHADIQTTMQTYGGTELDELRPINSMVVDSLFGRKQ